MDDDIENFDLADDLSSDEECLKGQRGEYVVYKTVHRRTARLTQHQRQYMLNYMVQHPNFARARCNQTKNKDQMWKYLTLKLNKLGPCKSITQWKVIWKELKSRVRKKVKSFKDGDNSASRNFLTEQEIKLNSILDGGDATEQNNAQVTVLDTIDPACKEKFDIKDTSCDNEEPSSTQHIPRRAVKKEMCEEPMKLRPVKFLRKAISGGSLICSDRRINKAIASSLASIADSMKKRVEIEERRTRIEAENNLVMKKLLHVLPKMFESVVQSELD